MPTDQNARDELAESALQELRERLAEVHHLLEKLRNAVWETRLRSGQTRRDPGHFAEDDATSFEEVSENEEEP